jgi:hypothetical protein
LAVATAHSPPDAPWAVSLEHVSGHP